MIRRGCIERTIEGNTMSEFITRSRAYAIAAPLLIFSPNANAQPAAIHRNVTAANATQEIVVTDQRRDERMQAVPISVVAITADLDAARGITAEIGST